MYEPYSIWTDPIMLWIIIPYILIVWVSIPMAIATNRDPNESSIGWWLFGFIAWPLALACACSIPIDEEAQKIAKREKKEAQEKWRNK